MVLVKCDDCNVLWCQLLVAPTTLTFWYYKNASSTPHGGPLILSPFVIGTRNFGGPIKFENLLSVRVFRHHRGTSFSVLFEFRLRLFSPLFLFFVLIQIRKCRTIYATCVSRRKVFNT
jgi:hypothetical protein